jgi:hypothetical protein
LIVLSELAEFDEPGEPPFEELLLLLQAVATSEMTRHARTPFRHLADGRIERRSAMDLPISSSKPL